MPRRLPRHRLARFTLAVVGLTTVAACSAGTSASGSSRLAPAQGGENAASHVATVGATAPAGTFTSLNAGTVDVAAYRGKPTVLWFIAADCSSCTASIPAVADHLNELRADDVTVAVIDLYGDLGQGRTAAHTLTRLGQKLAGPRFADPTWTWGISSRDLSYRYDPDGEPDVYYVLDRTGRITYRNGVPVSTMTDLLAHAHDAAQT